MERALPQENQCTQLFDRRHVLPLEVAARRHREHGPDHQVLRPREHSTRADGPEQQSARTNASRALRCHEARVDRQQRDLQGGQEDLHLERHLLLRSQVLEHSEHLTGPKQQGPQGQDRVARRLEAWTGLVPAGPQHPGRLHLWLRHRASPDRNSCPPPGRHRPAVHPQRV